MQPLACGIRRRTMEPHLDLRAEPAQLAGRGHRGQCTADVRIEEPRRIDAGDARCGRTAQQERPLAGLVQRVLRTKRACELRAPHLPLILAKAQQAPIGEPHVIEPGLKVNRGRQPHRTWHRFRPRQRANLRRRLVRELGSTELGREPRTPVPDRRGGSCKSKQPVEVRKIAHGQVRRSLVRNVEIGENQREPAHGGIVSDP
jgi:hypothetical protein